MEQKRPLAAVSDDELLRRLAELLRASRRVESDLVAHVAEVDERRLYSREAVPSMFAYCTEVLHLSEAEAYLRITVARASREHPVLLGLLADGSLHLTGVALLASHLTAENRDSLLRQATHRSKRQVEELVAGLSPRPDAPALMRRLPERQPTAPSLCDASRPPGAGLEPEGVTTGHPQRRPGEVGAVQRPGEVRAAHPELCPDRVAAVEHERGPDRVGAMAHERVPEGVGTTPELAGDATACVTASVQAAPSATLQPLGAARYRVQFTASAGLRDKLLRLRALLHTQVPEGDLAAVIELAVTEKLERVEARRSGVTRRPQPSRAQANPAPKSRHIPAAVRRAVRARDGSQCRYLDAAGRRCSERDRLEYHHRHPFGMGGRHSPENLRLMCRAHNDYLAVHDYGSEAMARHRHSKATSVQLNGAATARPVLPT
jgi:5-methylcytosine-specific restriction endonuclease McrA